MPKAQSKTRKHHTTVAIAAVVVMLVILVSNITTYMLTKNHYMKRYEGVCRTIESKQICSGELIGLSEEDATKLAEDKGFIPRVLNRDGSDIFHTFDLNSLHVNLYVRDDTVKRVDFDR